MLQANDNRMAKATDGTESQDSSQEGHKEMAAKQDNQKGLDNTAAGGSDAEFEKLLSEVRSTLPCYRLSKSLCHHLSWGSEACWHAHICLKRRLHS